MPLGAGRHTGAPVGERAMEHTHFSSRADAEATSLFVLSRRISAAMALAVPQAFTIKPRIARRQLYFAILPPRTRRIAMRTHQRR